VVPAFELTEVGELARYGIIGSFHYFKAPGARFATSLAGRGCRARCTFCSVRTFNGKGVRLRSVGSVLDELQRLEEQYGVEHVMWLDDDLLKDHTRAVAPLQTAWCSAGCASPGTRRTASSPRRAPTR
jgi:radical SAM superfamily enzyme YgiQ (UPF0313 family)